MIRSSSTKYIARRTFEVDVIRQIRNGKKGYATLKQFYSAPPALDYFESLKDLNSRYPRRIYGRRYLKKPTRQFNIPFDKKTKKYMYEKWGR